ncbi:MAG: guanylate kinase [Deltaproteobacteria bacterium]|nr:guanylate kinase [Deltaproteobacteria bacterium]
MRGWTAPDEGVLFVITGPSGVGKSTMIHALMAEVPGLEFSASATTRAPRAGEVDGVDYHFLDQDTFDRRVDAGAFLEHARVYDRSYGTLRAPVEQALRAGRSVILDIDLQGARQVRQSWPGAVHLMILPPRIAALEERLRARATDSEQVILRRMRQVEGQLAGVGEYDYLVVNDDLATATGVLRGVVLAELSRRSRRGSLVDAVLSELDPRKRAVAAPSGQG